MLVVFLKGLSNGFKGDSSVLNVLIDVFVPVGDFTSIPAGKIIQRF